MKNIFSDYTIGNHHFKNRIVLPPIVNFGWSDDSGAVSDKHIRHYESVAKGGAGLIIVEATCVKKEGRITSYQLGVWGDEHIDGLRKISKTVHPYGAKLLLQLHHAGLAARKTISSIAPGPSAHADIERSHELTIDEIKHLINDFVKAAIRAEKAGFDGVELHGAHGYLLSQFANSAVNLRTDVYGGPVENRLRMAQEIINGIRKIANRDFIISYRMSANSPYLTDGIEIAKRLEMLGVDLIHVSHGGEKGIIPQVPSGFDYNWIVYSGTEVKKHVKTPVIVVNEIKTPERANWLIQNGKADFTAIGRDMLTDKQWVNKAANNQEIDYCIQCQPRCKRFGKPESCPLFID